MPKAAKKPEKKTSNKANLFDDEDDDFNFKPKPKAEKK
jgi:hypothetical protein